MFFHRGKRRLSLGHGQERLCIDKWKEGGAGRACVCADNRRVNVNVIHNSTTAKRKGEISQSKQTTNSHRKANDEKKEKERKRKRHRSSTMRVQREKNESNILYRQSHQSTYKKSPTPPNVPAIQNPPKVYVHSRNEWSAS